MLSTRCEAEHMKIFPKETGILGMWMGERKEELTNGRKLWFIFFKIFVVFNIFLFLFYFCHFQNIFFYLQSLIRYIDWKNGDQCILYCIVKRA